jgi:hypothetical protein
MAKNIKNRFAEEKVTDFLIYKTAMTEWLCCLARTTKILYPNLDATKHGMTLDKSRTAVISDHSHDAY